MFFCYFCVCMAVVSYKRILSLAVPAVVANITVPLLGLTDTAIAGHIDASRGAVYLGALAVGSTAVSVVCWLLNFLRASTAGLTAQAYGAQDSRMQSLVLYRGVATAAMLGVMVLVVQLPLARWLLGFMDADAESLAMAREYFLIVVWGVPAVLCVNVLAGWGIGMQNSRLGMWMSLVTDIVNIPVSLWLAIGAGWGVAGLAVGTIVAQWTGLIVGVILLGRKYSLGKPDWNAILRWRDVRHFFRLNADVFLRTVCLVGVTLWFTHAGALQGPMILAVNALMMQFFMLFSYIMDGYGVACEAIAGSRLGAGADVRRTVVSLLKTGTWVALFFTLLYFLGGRALMSLLTSSAEVLEAARDYYWWVLTLPLAGFMAFTWDSIFIGLMYTRGMLVSMACATVAFFAFYFLFSHSLGNHGLWLAFVTYLLLRGLVQWALFRSMHHS